MRCVVSGEVPSAKFKKSHSPKKKKKKKKWLSEEALYGPENRRKVKGKEERERYTQLNAEFQRITRSEKKVLLSE